MISSISPPPSSFNLNVLIEVDHAAATVWRKRLDQTADGEAFAWFLKHPFLRSLMELFLNGAVSTLGFMALRQRGLCTVEEFVAQAGERRGLPVRAVEITPAGKSFLARMILDNERKAWFNQVVWGVTQYACRDVGHGIVLSQSHLESAMAAGDFAILRLCVDPDDLEYIFTTPTSTVVTDEDRLRRAAEWSPNFTRRRSAKVHRVEWEIGEPLHLEDDVDHDDPLDVAETFVDRKA